MEETNESIKKTKKNDIDGSVKTNKTKKIHLKILLTKKTYTLPYDNDETILDLKDYIYEECNIPISRQTIGFKTKILSNDIELRSLKTSRKKPLTCLGNVVEKEISMPVSDIIVHCMKFFTLKEISDCRLVCKMWSKLAERGSRFNDDRYTFKNGDCYDLLLGKVLYNVKRKFPEYRMLNNINFQRKYFNRYHGSPFLISELVKESNAPDAFEIVCNSVFKFETQWKITVKKPDHVKRKEEKQKEVVYVLQSRNSMEDDDNEEVEEEEEEDIQIRLQQFRDLVQDMSGDETPENPMGDFSMIQDLANLGEIEANKKIEQDHVVSAFYVSKYGICIVQTTKYVISLDVKTGKQLHLHIPQGENLYVMEVMDRPVSIHHNMLFVPILTGYEIIDVTTFKKMGVVKLQDMVNEPSVYILPLGNHVWLHVSDTYIKVIGSNGNYIKSFDTKYPNHIVFSPEFILHSSLTFHNIFEVDQTITHSIPLFYDTIETPLLGFYQENGNVGGYYTLKPVNNKIILDVDAMADITKKFEIAFVGLFQEEKRFYQGRDSFKSVEVGILSDIWKYVLPYNCDPSFNPIGMLEEDDLSVLYRVEEPSVKKEKLPHFHRLTGTPQNVEEEYYVLHTLEKNTGSSLFASEFSMPKGFSVSYAERLSSNIFVVFESLKSNVRLILLFNRHGTLCSARYYTQDEYEPWDHLHLTFFK